MNEIKKSELDHKQHLMKLFFNEDHVTLEVKNNIVKHQKCGQLLQLKFLCVINSELNLNMTRGAARCVHCDEFSGYQNDLITAIEVINKNIELKSSLDIKHWKEKLTNLSEESRRCCGLSHDLYIQIFSREVDCLLFNLDEDDKKTVIEMAKNEFNYLTENEVNKNIDKCLNSGCCQHGFPDNCCPLGCDDI